MSRAVRLSWRCLRALVVLCAAATSATGQSQRIIHGTVVDVRERPVASVSIAAVGGAAAVSDDSGHFRLEISHRDRLVFDVRRVGFMPSRISLEPGGDTSFSILLLPSAQRLEGVEVTSARGKSNSLAGFEERMAERRRAAGAGLFITAKDIESRPATRTTQVVENIPSIFVRRVSGDKYAIFARGVGGAECPATLWLDGIRVGGGSEQMIDRRGRITYRRETGEIDALVTPPEIAGVEVYARGMIAPPQFLPPNDPDASRCAVIVFWTKHG
jgi:TonB-dependent receptor-like protein